MSFENSAQTAFWNRDTALLFEMALVTAVFGMYVLFTLTSTLEKMESTDSHLLEQRYYAEQLENALLRYRSTTGTYPGGIDIPDEENTALPICRQSVAEAEGCITLDELIPDYIASIPVAKNTNMRNRSGYVVHLRHRMPIVTAEFVWDASAPFSNRPL